MARQPYVKKGTWSGDEDSKLIAYIMKYGIWNWNEMPKFAGLLRSGKSCRLRWMNYLKPNTRRGNFTTEEEEIIIHMQKKLGNRWSAIAARLPQRTDNDIKNYWNTRLKKRVMSENNNSGSANSSIEPESENSCDADSFVSSENTSAMDEFQGSELTTDHSSSSTIELEQESASDHVDSSTLLNVPIMDDFTEQLTYPSCHQIVEVDNTYTMIEEKFVSYENYWESFLEQPLMEEGLDCEEVSPNYQLWHDPLEDFWVNPLI